MMDCNSDSDDYYNDGFGPEISDENLEIYLDSVAASGGYDVEVVPGFSFGMIYPLDLEERPEVPRLASMAIDFYNQQNHTQFKVVEVLKSNSEVVSGLMYYITFKAEDANNGKIDTFQGKVWSKIPGKNREERFEIDECRIKPTTAS